MNQEQYARFDLSGGVQTATSRLLRKNNEVSSSKNAAFNLKIGSAVRRPGYEQVGETIQHGHTGYYAGVYKYSQNNKIIVGINNSTTTNTTLRYLDTGGYWTNIITDIAPSTRMDILNHLDELYVAGRAKNTDTYMTLQNVDGTLTRSLTRNVLNAPKCEFIAEYRGSLYAINVQIGNVKYRDRAYKSSGALGAITFVQGDQIGLIQQLTVDSVRYLKPGMIVDIYSAGSEAKIVDSLTIISVNKSKNYITFSATQINVKDNDEVWLEDRKGQLTHFWNTDYPNPELSDFLRIPPNIDQNPAITGHGKSNNRQFYFTHDSVWKWDGSNFVNVSENVGCVSHRTIKNIGNWILWLHTSGIWGYNDSTGQLKLLSRSIQNYIDAIPQAGFDNASAVVLGQVYKLSVGEIRTLDSNTTSTSTSSTSTSSTSSSTSSTSTSSTSTSSTSISTSSTSTSVSTSSTSTSRSTTSTSSTSKSTSTSSTSISTTSTSSTSTSISSSTSTSTTNTTTVPSSKNIVRIIYDFSMNAYWFEYHKREHRMQFTHTMHGLTKPYFIDETGRLFRDEIGDLDHNDTIPMELVLGRTHAGSRFIKKYDGCIVESEKAQGAQVAVSVDGQQFKNVGQVLNDVQEIRFDADLVQGRDIDYKITHNDGGEAPSIDGIESYFSKQEKIFG